MTDPSGTLFWQNTYDPYGNSPYDATTDYQFAGRELSIDGLYYIRARYYSPALQRFVLRDPSGLAGGINMYAYAGDDPVNFSDPTGLQAIPVMGLGPNGWAGEPGFYAFFGYASFGFAPGSETGFLNVGSFGNWFGLGTGSGATWGNAVSFRPNRGGIQVATRKDKWYGYRDETFRRCYHRQWKDEGGRDATKDELDEDLQVLD